MVAGSRAGGGPAARGLLRGAPARRGPRRGPAGRNPGPAARRRPAARPDRRGRRGHAGRGQRGWRYDIRAIGYGTGGLDPYGTEFFAAALGTATLAGEPPAGRWPWPATRYTDPQGRFGLLVPSGFVVDDEYPHDPVRFRDPQSSAGSEFERTAIVSVSVSSAYDDAAGYADLLRPAMAKDGIQLTRDEPVVLADGTAAHLLSGIEQDPGWGLGRVRHEVLAVRDGRLVSVAVEGDPDVLREYPPDMVDTTLLSLTLAP